MKLSEVRSYLSFCKETQNVEVTPKNHPGFIRPKHNLFKMRDGLYSQLIFSLVIKTKLALSSTNDATSKLIVLYWNVTFIIQIVFSFGPSRPTAHDNRVPQTKCRQVGVFYSSILTLFLCECLLSDILELSKPFLPIQFK